MSNIVISPRPHHPIVQNLECLFLGQFKCRAQTKKSYLPIVNEWLTVLCIFFLTTIVAELILRW